MIFVRIVVAALWLTLGLGIVPTAVYLALGLLLVLPFPEVGRHLLKLAARAADPLGTRVCNFQGQGTLRWFPLLAGAAAANAVVDSVDPHGDLQDLIDDDRPRRPGEGAAQPEGAGIEAVLAVVWVLTVGWELMLFHAIVGVLLCLTLVGAVFGVRHLALAVVSLLPTMFVIARAEEPLPRRRPRFVLRA